MLENVRSVGRESYQNKILARTDSGKTKESVKADGQDASKGAEVAKTAIQPGNEQVRDSLQLSGKAKTATGTVQGAKTEQNKALTAEEQLSDKAKTYLKNLRRSRNHVDFRISEKGKETESLQGQSNKQFTVVLSNEEIEKMATDKKFERQQLNTLDQTVKSMLLAQTKMGNDNGLNKTNAEDIKNIAVKTKEDGTTYLIASLEKNANSARKIAEEQDKKREAKKLEEKQEAKRLAKQEALKGNGKTDKLKKTDKAEEQDKLSKEEDLQKEKSSIKRIEVQGRTIDELMENMKKVDWSKVPYAE